MLDGESYFEVRCNLKRPRNKEKVLLTGPVGSNILMFAEPGRVSTHML